MEECVIIDFVRTPFSRSRPGKAEKDVFHKLRADDLAAMNIKEILKRTSVDATEIDDCLIGCALQLDENWLDGGRITSLVAGLPFNVPAMGMDRQCASSLSTIQIGAMEIMTGMANNELVIAGGMEHMTRIPMNMIAKVPVNPGFFNDTRYDSKIALNMGLTAEKLFSESGLTREDIDKWSVRSHQMAEKALNEGYFKGEIFPVEGVLPDGTTKLIEQDQAIRIGATLEKTASLKPAFKEDGVITAGNASPLNAGAAFVMLASKKKAEALGKKPLATIKAMSVAGVDPTVMGKGPVPASEKVLKKAGLKASDIDFWEINEAFAVVALYSIQKLGIEPERVNVKGGAIAIGHPLGASGTRLTGTLARILNEKEGRYGIATLCVGGGQGAAILLERE